MRRLWNRTLLPETVCDYEPYLPTFELLPDAGQILWRLAAGRDV